MSPRDGAQSPAAGKSGPRELRIFLNYRREDAADAAGRLFDALAARFGDGQVFMDIDDIEPGLDFEEVVNQAVDTSDVLIAVIGRQWLTTTDPQGRRRLDNPDDYVRMELRAALDRNVRVIPVLVQGVDMPRSDELPDALKRLAKRNAVEVSTTRWRYDIGRLATALERIAETGPEQQLRAETAEEQLGEHDQARQGAVALGAKSQGPDSRSQPPASSPPGRSRNRLPQILLGIVATVGIAVGALLASGAFSHSGSAHAGTPATSAANNASTVANPAPGTTGSAASGSLPQNCGTGIDTTQNLSCGLANNVFYEYYKAIQNGGNGTALSAWSSTTKQYYSVSCSPGAGIVKCAVSGTSNPNAEVDLTQSALGAYSSQQASSYAANADLGPNG